MMIKVKITFLACFLAITGFAQPVSLDKDIAIEFLTDGGNGCVRLDQHPITGELMYVTISGDIFKVNPETGTKSQVFSSSAHGLSNVMGFDIGASGNIYLVSADHVGSNNVATIKKYANQEWSTIATATYPSPSGRDHHFNSVIETPDQQFILVNSGARTDHGEENDDGTREMPLTTKIFKLPVDSENLILTNDRAFLVNGGYIYSEGVRNTFDLAYAPNGDLFGVENSDTRDNEEELNWLREGKHYGFPWRIGTQANPQQFEGFDPPDSDPLLVAGINMESTFYNDPDYPAAPDVDYVEPVLNYGPDADHFRDGDGQIKDGSDMGSPLGTFTPHSSPLAITFDVDSAFGGIYKGKGFAMSYNDATLRKYEPFNDPGEDLLMLDLTKTDDTYSVAIHRIAEGFDGPIDAAIIGNKMYILEYGGGQIWKVTFPEDNVIVTGLPTAGLKLLEIFPNSFSEKLNIHFTADHHGVGLVEVYSLEGKKVSKLWEGNYNAGELVGISWISSELNAGIYILKVTTHKGVYQQRVVKIK